MRAEAKVIRNALIVSTSRGKVIDVSSGVKDF